MIHPTNSPNNRSSVAGGSDVIPVCTAEGWIIVELGAVSQWNRSARSIRAIGPPFAAPDATADIATSCDSTKSGSVSGESAFNFQGSSAQRIPRNRSERENTTTPALKDSPRSTLGTTRSTV